MRNELNPLLDPSDLTHYVIGTSGNILIAVLCCPPHYDIKFKIYQNINSTILFRLCPTLIPWNSSLKIQFAL